MGDRKGILKMVLSLDGFATSPDATHDSICSSNVEQIVLPSTLIMARSLHVRLDDSSATALDVIRAEGMSDSEAVRTAQREAAARRRVRSSIAEEVRELAADEADREEMRIIREQLADLAPPPPE
jgi:transcriptional accessory protein Tex/SPT6